MIAANEMNLLQMIFGGSWIGVVIMLLLLMLSMVSLYFVADHFLTIGQRRLFPEDQLEQLEQLIAAQKIDQAIDYCYQPDRDSMAVRVIGAGLQRYRHSQFGFAEYRAAVEEAGADETSKLFRRTEVLATIAAIAPMLGLTGTVVGMIEAFMTIANQDGAAQAQDLAGGIGQALVTTLMGLAIAMPTMVACNYFRHKIEAIVSLAGKRIEHIMLPLGKKG
jgi:biopolymer transport protein ExbB